MKRKLIALFMLCLVLLSLVGCGKNYQEAVKPDKTYTGNGYFTTVKQWGNSVGMFYEIVYANDTNVMYFVMGDGYTSGITPLYNKDGTL